MTSKSESAVNTINELLSDSGAGSPGTNHSSGTPFVSLVNVARFSATALVMLLSGLAQHTRNLRAATVPRRVTTRLFEIFESVDASRRHGGLMAPAKHFLILRAHARSQLNIFAC